MLFSIFLEKNKRSHAFIVRQHCIGNLQVICYFGAFVGTDYFIMCFPLFNFLTFCASVYHLDYLFFCAVYGLCTILLKFFVLQVSSFHIFLITLLCLLYILFSILIEYFYFFLPIQKKGGSSNFSVF